MYPTFGQWLERGGREELFIYIDTPSPSPIQRQHCHDEVVPTPRRHWQQQAVRLHQSVAWVEYWCLRHKYLGHWCRLVAISDENILESWRSYIVVFDSVLKLAEAEAAGSEAC